MILAMQASTCVQDTCSLVMQLECARVAGGTAKGFGVASGARSPGPRSETLSPKIPADPAAQARCQLVLAVVPV